MKEIIHETLNELGVPFGTLGRDYLESAVEFVLERGRMAITKELYPLIARAFGTTPTRVERAIRHSIEITFYNNQPNGIERFFGNTVSLKSGKLNNSDFIYGVVKHITVYKIKIQEE